MPPADQDGKKLPESPASPFDESSGGGDPFDWDTALSDWDPTFQTEADVLPPELSGKATTAPPVVGTATADGEAAPLPPPPSKPPLAVEPIAAATKSGAVAPVSVPPSATKSGPVEPVAAAAKSGTVTPVSVAPVSKPSFAAEPVAAAGKSGTVTPVSVAPVSKPSFAAEPVAAAGKSGTVTPVSVAPISKPLITAEPVATAGKSGTVTPVSVVPVSKPPFAAEPVSAAATSAAAPTSGRAEEPAPLPPLAIAAPALDALPALLVETPAKLPAAAAPSSADDDDYDIQIEGEPAPPAAMREPEGSQKTPAFAVYADPFVGPEDAQAAPPRDAAASIQAQAQLLTADKEKAKAAPMVAAAPVAPATDAPSAPLSAASSSAWNALPAPTPAGPMVNLDPPDSADSGDDELEIQIGTTAAPSPESEAPAAVASEPAPPAPAAAVGVAPPPLAAEPVARPVPRSGQPLVPRRIPLPELGALPPPPPAVVGASLEAATRRHFLSLLDAEVGNRQSEPEALPLLLYAARQLEGLREPADALERYRTALDVDKNNRTALRASRRLLSFPGPTAAPDEAAMLLERELERSSPAEQTGLALVQGELLRTQGTLSEAQKVFQQIVGRAKKPERGADAHARIGGLAAHTALADIAVAQGQAQELVAHIDALLDAHVKKGQLRVALQIERARLDESAGRDQAAAARYETVWNASSPNSVCAGLGWVRTAVRLPRTKKDEPAPYARAQRALLDGAIPRGLRSALLRQAAAAGGSEAETLLSAAAQLGDWLAGEDLAELRLERGDAAGAATAYLEVAESTRDAALRSYALSAGGEAARRAGQLPKAREALAQSLSVARTADLEHDPLTERALAQVSRALGRPEDLLSLWGQQAGQSPSQDAAARYSAAELLLGQKEREGARAAAIGELVAALRAVPDHAQSLALLTELYLEDERPEEAARLFVQAAAAIEKDAGPSEQIKRQSYREQAARLLRRAGRLEEAAQILAADVFSTETVAAAPSFRPALQARLWSVSVQLGDKLETKLGELVGEALRVAAEESPSPQQAAAHWLRRALVESGRKEPPAAPEMGAAEQSLQRVLSVLPGHTAALLLLYLRTLPVGEATGSNALAPLLLESLRARLEEAKGRPEALLWGLRLATVEEGEARDAASALKTYQQLRQQAGENHPSLVGLEDTLFITAWRGGHALDLLDRDLERETDLVTRFGLQLLAGEQLESRGVWVKAAERYGSALEMRPNHPVAKAGLVRNLQASGQIDALIKLTNQELKEASDVQTRVAAYERQAMLAGLRNLSPDQRCEETIAAYRNMLTFDANNHSAMRALERQAIIAGHWADLIQLYEQMGLTATDTAFAVHIHLDRARLRRRLAWQAHSDEQTLANELENDFRLAMYRDRHCRPAQRYLLAAAMRRGELAQVAELSAAVAELCMQPGDQPGTESGEPLSAAVFLTRVAEAQAALGRPVTEVVASYRAAVKRVPDHLPALRGMLHYSITHRDLVATCEAAEGLGQFVKDPEERYRNYMLAGVIAQELLKDLERARRAFRAGLALLPEREEAFERLRVSYTGRIDGAEVAQGLASLLRERLESAPGTPQYQSTLRLDLAQLLAGPLNDRAQAKAELQKALEQTPSQPSVLYTLGKLHADDREWQPAVELLSRYGGIEQRPAQLVALHLLLAEIFQEHLKDSQKAIFHYTRVLQIQPQNLLTLTKLADLFIAEKRGSVALPLFRKLVKVTDDKQKKITYYLRIAALSEQDGDLRGATEALRQAVDVDPMNLSAIGELAKFYDRQSDVQSMRIHLDRAAARFRPLLREKPRDPAAYQSLLQIFLWRRSPDVAAMAAQAMVTFGGSIPGELQAQLDALPKAKEATRTGLRDATFDDLLYPAKLAPGFRALFKLLAEPFGKLYGSDAKKLAALGVDKREKLPRSGHPVRDLANKLAADFGVGDFDLYLTAAQGKGEDGKPMPLYTIEPTEVPSLIISSSLIEPASETERRFLLAGLVKLLQSSLMLPLRLSADDLGVLVGGLVRQFVPDYTPLGFAEKRIINEAQRQGRQISRKLHPQILPFALECASASLDFEGIAETLIMSSHHAGLVLTGQLGAAIAAIRRKGTDAERQIDDLLRFAVSDEYAELRRLATA